MSEMATILSKSNAFITDQRETQLNIWKEFIIPVWPSLTESQDKVESTQTQRIAQRKQRQRSQRNIKLLKLDPDYGLDECNWVQSESSVAISSGKE